MWPSEGTFSRRRTCRFFMACFSEGLVDEGQEPHVARALDRVLQQALALCREPGAAAREHLALAPDALPQELDVLVIEVFVLDLDLLVGRRLEAVATVPAVTTIVAHGSDLLSRG